MISIVPCGLLEDGREIPYRYRGIEVRPLLKVDVITLAFVTVITSISINKIFSYLIIMLVPFLTQRL